MGVRSPCHIPCQVVPREGLPVQALARLEFGEHLLAMLGLDGTVKLQVAKNLPPALLAGTGRTGGGVDGRDEGANANAFRNSYLWNANTGVLYLHGKIKLFEVPDGTKVKT